MKDDNTNAMQRAIGWGAFFALTPSALAILILWRLHSQQGSLLGSIIIGAVIVLLLIGLLFSSLIVSQHVEKEGYPKSARPKTYAFLGALIGGLFSIFFIVALLLTAPVRYEP